MYPQLKDRAAAVQWLISNGLYAALRDWSFGESVVAATGRQVLLDEDGKPLRNEASGEELVIYAHMLCIYPEQESWSVANVSGGKKSIQSYTSLGEAAFEAAKSLAEKALSFGNERDA